LIAVVLLLLLGCLRELDLEVDEMKEDLEANSLGRLRSD
jgi:hypothetical protein